MQDIIKSLGNSELRSRIEQSDSLADRQFIMQPGSTCICKGGVIQTDNGKLEMEASGEIIINYGDNPALMIRPNFCPYCGRKMKKTTLCYDQDRRKPLLNIPSGR